MLENKSEEYEVLTLADMHTHTEHSHDSQEKLENLAEAQIKGGTRLFAVTNHFDTFAYTCPDAFAPLREQHAEVLRLREQYGDSCDILSGIEIGEGYLNPEAYEGALKLCDWDVVIGSVHYLTNDDVKIPYSLFDFRKLSTDRIYAFLDEYFVCLKRACKTMDFDILAHLTCPIRYINGIYSIELDLSRYDKMIDEILSDTITRGRALEINTSTEDFCPTRNIVERYFKMGGRIVTLGSDAHICKHASRRFPSAVKMLRDIGFEYIYYYKKRKPYRIKI